MGFFGAVSRWFRAFGYLLAGKTDSARRNLDANPVVMRAKYDDIIEGKKRDVNQYMEAVASIMTQRAQKMLALKRESDEVIKLENQKAGAIAMAKKIANGRSQEEIQKNPAEWGEYQKCKMFHHDFSTTSEAKKKHIEELTASVKDYDQKVADHTVTLTKLQKDIQELKVKASDNVARIISAKQEESLGKMLSGLSTGNSHDAEIARMDEMVSNAEAKAQISGTLAGTDANRLTAQFEAAATEAASNDEFDSLVGTRPTQKILDEGLAPAPRIMGNREVVNQTDSVSVNH